MLAMYLLVVAGLTSVVSGGPAVAQRVSPNAAGPTATLCWGYVGCSNAGMGNAGYAAVNRTMYWRMYAGHNCTNYAAYRMIRSGMPNVRPWTGSGNATNWGVAMRSITDGTPAVGAVAWWRAYVSPAGSAGHVAYVEKVVSPTEIIVSQDAWGGDFSWKRISRAAGGWPSGFVHFNDLSLRSTGRPTVLGTAKVGSTVRATTGTWSLPVAALSYQWLADGIPVSGATAGTLALSPDLEGRAVSVRVTASRAGYPAATAVSAATRRVAAGTLTNADRPTIVGTPEVGRTLSATPGTWGPGDASFGYIWKSDGVAIRGETSPTLTLAPQLVGKRIGLRVVATRPGYVKRGTLAVRTAPVRAGTLHLTRAPSLTGTARPGRTLTVRHAPVTPRGARVSLQWLRDGVPVAGATHATYRLGTGDLGRRVTAALSAHLTGYHDLTAQAPPSDLVRVPPVLTVTTQPGRRTLRLAVHVSASGVAAPSGVVAVWLRGKMLTTFDVRRGGGTTTLRSVPPGSQPFRIRFRGNQTVEPLIAWRRVAITG
jgi:surface antigen